MRLLTSIILAFAFCTVSAQDALIKGKITDARSKETLPGVTVVLNGTPGTTTDVNGNYEMKVSPGNLKVEFMLIGYRTFAANITVNAGEAFALDANMTQALTELDVVVVSAGKFEQKLSDVTVSMEVIRPELVENKNTTNLETVIDQVPGVNVMDGQCNIRGGSGFSYGAGSRVLMLVDELPMLSADAGDVKWNYLPVENLSQLEIIKGASSALFGSSALNGVINIRTAYPVDTPLTKINVYSGMYGNPARGELVWWENGNPTYSGMEFMHSRMIKNLDLVVGGHLFDDDGYRELETEQRLRANANLRYRFPKVEGLTAGVNVNAMQTKGGLFLLWQDADSGAYRPSGGELQNYKNTRFNIDPFIAYSARSGQKHSLRTRFFRSDNVNDTEQGSLADLYYSEYQFQKRFERDLTVTSGIVGTYSTITADSLYGRHEGQNIGIYGQVDKKIKKLTFSLGLRGEYFKVDTAQTKGTFLGVSDLPFQPVLRSGVNYHVAEYTYLRASYGQGYRFPSIAEKFVNTTVGALKIFPNPDLQPETGWSAEIGAKQGFRIKNWKGFIDVAGFWTEYKNMMEFTFGYHVPDSIKNPSLIDMIENFGAKSINVGNARITGVDVTVSGTGKIYGIGTTLLAGYTYTNPIDLNYDASQDSTGNPNGGVLKYRYYHNAKVDMQLQYKKLETGFSMRYNSFMINIDSIFGAELFNDILPTFHSNTYILPGINEYREKHSNGDIVVDYRISYQMSSVVKSAFIVKNIFNREYMSRPGDIQAPRTFAVQISMKF
jgi:outer membrane receptor protein involved in Fe transport